jgi:uncharacterized cupredoxin-like copper-binding protein
MPSSAGTSRGGSATTTATSPGSGRSRPATYTFPAALDGRALEFACHLPGHYAYGMHGLARVSGG